MCEELLLINALQRKVKTKFQRLIRRTRPQLQVIDSRSAQLHHIGHKGELRFCQGMRDGKWIENQIARVEKQHRFL